MNGRRVVITGLGALSPLGAGALPLYRALLEGRHGFAPIRSFDPAGFTQRNGAEVSPEFLREALGPSPVNGLDRCVEMGLAAASEAFRAAGLDPYRERPWAALFGSALGCLHGVTAAQSALIEKGVRGVRPTSLPRCMNNALSANLSIRFKLTGPNYTVVSACASSSAALGQAYRMIRAGWVDGALAGGSDATFIPVLAAAWNNLGLLSSEPDPALCCRPFDRDRAGTAMGEGAAAWVLEEREQARARGATILGEILGFAETSDASHLAQPRAEGQAECVRAALTGAGLAPEDLAFVSAHGTGAPVSDRVEAEALHMVLGAAAARVPVVSFKSYFGHTQGACGAMEGTVALLALREGRLPGNRNLRNPDPACPIRLAAPTPSETGRGACLKTCFGFGGHNTALLLGRPD